MTAEPEGGPERFPSVGDEAPGQRIRWYLGSGLPASLSAERVREVLELTRRDERLFQDRLDERGGFFWRSTGVDGGLYERLRELLRTPGGRVEYEVARQDLRRKNSKSFGKLDFGFRLVGRCLEDLGLEAEDVIRTRGDFDPAQHFRDAERPDLEAQFLWGSALAASEDRPWAVGSMISFAPGEEIREVRDGLVPVGSVAHTEEFDSDIEPEQLLERFRTAVMGLTIDRTGPERLLQVRSDLDRICALIEKREAKRGELLREFDGFVERYRGASIPIGLVDRCISLVTVWRSGKQHLSPDLVDKAMSAAALLFDAEQEIRSRRKLIDQAVKQEDYELLGTLSAETAEFAGKRDRQTRNLDACLDEWPETGLEGDNSVPGYVPDETGPDGSQDPDSGRDCGSGTDDTTPGQADQATADEAESSVSREPQAANGSGEASAEEGERAAPGAEDKPADDGVEAAIARAVGNGRWGIAYQLALRKRRAYPGGGAIRLAAANLVTDADDAIEAELPGIAAEAMDFFENRIVGLPGARQQSEQVAVAILLACAGFLPALRAPGGPVVRLLGRLDAYLEACPALRALVRTTEETLATTDMPLTPQSLSLNWDEQLAAIGSSAARWIESERLATLAYAPATDLWHHLLEPWQESGRSSIGAMFELMALRPDSARVRRAQRIADFWRGNADREIDRLHQDRYGHTNARIDGRARIRLREKVTEAAEHVDRWSACLAEKPSGAKRYQQPIAKALRGAADTHGEIAVEEVRLHGGSYASCSGSLLKGYLCAIRGDAATTRSPGLRLRDLLEGEFLPWLAIPAVPTPRQAMAMLDAPEPDMAEAARQSIETGLFARADGILDYAARRNVIPDADRVDLLELLERKRAAAEVEFDRHFDEIEQRIQHAEEQHAFDSEKAEELRTALLAAIESGPGNHRERMVLLERARTAVDRAIGRCKREIRKSFKTVKHPPARTAHQFEKAIREGRLQDAREILGKLQQQVGAG